MVIATKTPLSLAMNRVLIFVESGESHVATRQLQEDIVLVTSFAASDDYWRPRLACARRLLEKKKCTEASYAQTCRAMAKRRYLANRAARAEENRERAKLGGSAKKQKK